MRFLKWYVFQWMDRACDITGHDTFMCWNRGQGRVRNLAHHVWAWSLDLER